VIQLERRLNVCCIEGDCDRESVIQLERRLNVCCIEGDCDRESVIQLERRLNVCWIEGDCDHESMIQLERRLNAIEECDEFVTDENVTDWILQLVDDSNTDNNVGVCNKNVNMETGAAAGTFHLSRYVNPSDDYSRKQV
jgi:hypothetical protein